MSDEGYVVAVKPSARRTCAGAGAWVNRHGSRTRFDSKALAREWARELSGPRSPVWIQDAPPHDGSEVDGYLVGGDRRGRPRESGTEPTRLAGDRAFQTIRNDRDS